jgi:tetratricopeptide (TPR) repeat protein
LTRNLDARVFRGRAYLALGETERAVADFEASIKLNARYAPAYSGRGEAYERKGDRERAIADHRKALSLDATLEASRAALERLGAEP